MSSSRKTSPLLWAQSFFVFLAFVFPPLHPALASEDFGRLNVMEKNDYFGSKDDRHYTQGVRFSYTTGAVTQDGFWDQPFGMLEDNLSIFTGEDRKRKYEWTILGQSIF